MKAWAEIDRETRCDVVDASRSNLNERRSIAVGHLDILRQIAASGTDDGYASPSEIERAVERVARFDRAIAALASLSTT